MNAVARPVTAYSRNSVLQIGPADQTPASEATQSSHRRRNLLVKSRSCERINKWARLRERLRDPEWRRYGYALLAGKVIAILLLMVTFALVSSFTGGAARADDPVLKGNDIVNPLNTLWTLLAA